jgi:GNAT superfamily N-acetyltransferase
MIVMADPGLSGLCIRDARPEELDEVSLLIRDAYQQYQKSIPPLAWEAYMRDLMDVRSRLGIAELIVAELDGRPVGTVTLYSDTARLPQQMWPGGWAGIRILAVGPAYRGRGIGRALMNECVRRCRERGISAVGLHTTETMDVARRLYERMGFIRAPEFDFHPASGVVVMAYRLDL